MRIMHKKKYYLMSNNYSNSTNEFRRLNILYNNNLTTNATNLMQAPLYLARSGYIEGGSIKGPSSGCYWSSTATSLKAARYLSFSSSFILPETDYDYRHAGFNLRCVLREFWAMLFSDCYNEMR